MLDSSSQLPQTVYESVYRHSPVSEYLLSPPPDYLILSVNDTFLATLGRSREELVGKSLFVAFPAAPNDSEDTGVSALRRSLEKVVETGKSDTLAVQRYPIRVTTASGEERYEERFWSAVNTPIHDEEGKLICIAHSTIDVTDLVSRKPQVDVTQLALNERARLEAGVLMRAQTLQQINKALEAERIRLRHLFEHAPGFVYFTRGPNHVIEQANAALFDLVGQRDIIGRSIREAFPDVAGQGFFQLHDEVFRSGKPHIMRGRSIHIQSLPNAEPEERFIDVVYQPIIDADGAVVGICGQGNDITERKRAEDEVRDANRRKDEFLAMLAHELRNPLAPISAAATILSRPRLDEGTLLRTSGVIGRQVKHMTDLVNDLLDVSRVTRGLVSVEQRPEDLKQVIANAVEQVRPMIDSKGHHLAIDLLVDPAHVCGDHKRLVQIVTNLLNNAAKYTPGGGRIQLRLESEANELLIRVVDTGIGISPELQPRVFDLFAQGERSADRAQGGLGLGLALVKSLVQMHGGWVRCFSEGVGKGSCFTVSLPKLTQDLPLQQKNPQRKEQQRNAGPSRNVLLVDDNVDAARTLCLLLELAGHRVAVEYNGNAALERARAELPEVYLLDIGLPDMSGKELAQRLRTESFAENSFIVAVTGYGQDLDRSSALASGFDEYLVKPVEADALLALLSSPKAINGELPPPHGRGGS
jgi:PAS domain S-box-containing protein